MAVAAATDVLPTPPFPVKRITRTTGQSRGAGRKPGRGIWGPGGPNAPGPPTRGPRETRGFRGVGSAGARALAMRTRAAQKARVQAGRIRRPHEACFVGWMGARGPVRLFGRTSSDKESSSSGSCYAVSTFSHGIASTRSQGETISGRRYRPIQEWITGFTHPAPQLSVQPSFDGLAAPRSGQVVYLQWIGA